MSVGVLWALVDISFHRSHPGIFNHPLQSLSIQSCSQTTAALLCQSLFSAGFCLTSPKCRFNLISRLRCTVTLLADHTFSTLSVKCSIMFDIFNVGLVVCDSPGRKKKVSKARKCELYSNQTSITGLQFIMDCRSALCRRNDKQALCILGKSTSLLDSHQPLKGLSPKKFLQFFPE